MLVRVQFRLLCASEADAIAVADAIRQKVASKTQRVTHSAVTVSPGHATGEWLVTGDVSFHVRADADDVYNDAQAKWSSGQLARLILTGSRVTLHVCSHADGEPPPWENCRNIDYQLATKA
jgi:hypothetical protein